MKYILDTEFIDTPGCSALISLALMREDGAYRYFEFEHPKDQLTDWLRQNVVPHLSGSHTSVEEAAHVIRLFIGSDKPEFWCYFGAYDWYWFCRLFGGLMNLPNIWPRRYCEFADLALGVPPIAGPEHHALNDCRSILAAMKRRGLSRGADQ